MCIVEYLTVNFAVESLTGVWKFLDLSSRFCKFLHIFLTQVFRWYIACRRQSKAVSFLKKHYRLAFSRFMQAAPCTDCVFVPLTTLQQPSLFSAFYCCLATLNRLTLAVRTLTVVFSG